MAKGQKRSNKEIKKPKKKPSEAVAAVALKGISATDMSPKKK